MHMYVCIYVFVHSGCCDPLLQSYTYESRENKMMIMMMMSKKPKTKRTSEEINDDTNYAHCNKETTSLSTTIINNE